MEYITNQDLEKYADLVKNDIKYGHAEIIIDKALKDNPQNDDIAMISMKISLIDITNGTNLSRNLGKEDGLYKLAEKISTVDFDNRVRVGELTLVEELARWTKENLGKNLFSFISKYCLYHNVHCYDRDDYAIFDSVLCKNIYKYIEPDEYNRLTNKSLKGNSFFKMKEEYNYKQYMEVLNYILEKIRLQLRNRIEN